MTTSESKGRFFYKTNLFESIRITNRRESIRIANRNALLHSERWRRADAADGAVVSGESTASEQATHAHGARRGWTSA